MKKLLFILPVIFFTLAANAQQTEDEVYIGKGKTFGNYTGRSIIIPETDKTIKEPNSGQTTVSGVVVGYCKKDCCYRKNTFCSVDVKKDDGTIVTVGTRDNGFTVPRKMVGRKIIVEGISLGRLRREINPRKPYQPDIQFAATGLMVID